MRAFSREPERNNLAVLSTGSAAERPAAAEIGGRPHPVRDETNAQQTSGPRAATLRGISVVQKGKRKSMAEERTRQQQLEQLLPSDSRDSGWTRAMGMTFTTLGPEQVALEWTVGPEHLQPFGLVHGGVYCGAIETVCSVGAVLAAGADIDVVGVENHTSFLRPVRS